MATYIKTFEIEGIIGINIEVEIEVEYSYEPSDDGIDDYTCISIEKFEPSNIGSMLGHGLAKDLNEILRENQVSFDQLQDEIIDDITGR